MNPICEECKKEITPEQQHSGFYSGGQAYAFGKDYMAGPAHRTCRHLGSLLKEHGFNLTKIHLIKLHNHL